uniref:Uncharacterized protein n=1 Tax=Ficedula albicollis TaxID=59894 RepID=A0A803WCD0_FICAL
RLRWQSSFCLSFQSLPTRSHFDRIHHGLQGVCAVPQRSYADQEQEGWEIWCLDVILHYFPCEI